MTEFTPLASLAGGMLIGVAAVMLMALNGRIAGLTGIISGLLPPSPAPDWPWRLAFIVMAASAPVAIWVLTGAVPRIQVPVGTQELIIGGFIAGIGVTLASGCTSGHGICGLARLSARSAVAVVVFMATTGLTVLVVRHVAGG